MKTKFISALYALCIVLLMSFTLHKHYISLTKIDYAPEEKALQITMRFFIDDLEKGIENRNDTQLALATPQENKNSNVLIERYIRQKFKVFVNEAEMKFTYLGKQYENDEVYFFLEINQVNEINSIAVQNRMLFEIYEEQQNYIKISIEKVNKTFILVKSNDKEMLKLTSAD